MKQAIGVSIVLLLLVGFMHGSTSEWTKEPRRVAVTTHRADSLRQWELETAIFDEYLRVKFDQCTPESASDRFLIP